MPELSEKYSRRDADGYRETFSFGLRTMAFVVVPSAVGMISLSEPIVGLLYERGSFDAAGYRSVSGLLVVYAAGLLGYSVYFYLVRAFYSRQNTKTPAVLNVVIFVLYAALAYGLSQRLGRHRRGARAHGGLLGARRAEPRGDAPGDGPVGRPAPPRLRPQDARRRDGHVRRRQARNVAPRGGLGLRGAPLRPRRGRRRLARRLPRGGVPSGGGGAQSPSSALLRRRSAA